MKLTIYQVDAFSSQIFGGNPAAVIPLDAWLDDSTLQAIAQENNLSETVYFVPENDLWRIRWFTPNREVDLCGHATLATAHVMYEHLGIALDKLQFQSLSGLLTITRDGDGYAMNFPIDPIEQIPVPSDLAQVPGCEIEACFRGRHDFMIVIADESTLLRLQPDLRALTRIDTRGLIITAPADPETPADFVSRCFFPKFGIDEDPVTGSAHTTMMPYWAKRLDRNELVAIQQSARRGVVKCQLQEERIRLAGDAVTFLEGQITIPPSPAQ